MNRINPLYIGALLIGILILLVMQLNSAKSNLEDVKSEYKKTKQIVSKLSSLKNSYGKKDKIKKSLQRVLNLSSLKSADIKQVSMKNGLSFSAASMDKKALDSLMGKLLNGTYNIEKFKIKKLNANKVSFEMEIKW